jgi:hypothetical protein
MKDRGKTVTKPGPLSPLGLALSEKQIPQVIEKPESGDKRKEALERVVMRPRQVRPGSVLLNALGSGDGNSGVCGTHPSCDADLPFLIRVAGISHHRRLPSILAHKHFGVTRE